MRNGDKKGELTEQLIQNLADRSGYKVIAGGKYQGNKGFAHVLQGRDGTVIIIDSKQLRRDGSVQVSNSGIGNTNQLSEQWIRNVANKLPNTDPTKNIVNKSVNDGTIKTLIAGVDKTTGEIKLIPVNVPNKGGKK